MASLPGLPARDAAQQLSLSIRKSEWRKHLCAPGSTLSLDRKTHALAFEGDDGDELPTTRLVWLTLESPTHKQLIRVSEALALLQLVHELDPEQWFDTLEDLWSNELAWCDDRRNYLLGARATVGLTITITTTEHITWISERLVGSEPPSPRYCVDFEALQQAIGADAPVQAHTSRIPVSVMIRDVDDLGTRDRVLGQLLQLAATQHRLIKLARLERVEPSTSIRGMQERPCFQIVEMAVDGPILKQMDELGLDYVRRIAACDVRFKKLASLKIEDELQLETTHILHALILPRGQSRRQYFAVVEVELSEWSSPNMIAPVLSALQVSQAVQRVYITMDRYHRTLDQLAGTHRETLWQWIAYALFSRHARHNIQEVELDMRFLSTWDVSDFHLAVLSENPLGQPGSDHRSQYICASRFFVERGSELLALQIDSPNVVHVVARDEGEPGDYWRVILPGCGVVLVHEDDATELPEGSGEHGGKYPSIKRFKLSNGSAESRRIGYDFLRLLKCHVESIEFTDELQYTVRGEGCYTPVLTACPGLKRLVTPPGLVDDSLVEVAELAMEGKCELEELEVSGPIYLRGRAWRDLIQFFEALADVDHPLSRHLSRLELNLSNEDPNDIDSTIDREDADKMWSGFVAAVHKMHNQNRRLNTIVFHFYGFEDEDPIGWPEEEVAIRTGPLALCNKLALLSVLASPDTTRSINARSLPTAVVSIIFEFAAEHCIRRVVMWTMNAE